MAGNSRSGRRRKPLEVRIADGTYKESDHGKVVALPADHQARPAPRGLDRFAKQFWVAVASQRIVDDPAAVLLQSGAEWYGIYRRAMADLKKHPYDRDIRRTSVDAFSAWDKVASQFGAGPADRAKLGLLPRVEEAKRVATRARA